MQITEELEINPGQELQAFLKDLFNITSSKNLAYDPEFSSDTSFINKVDFFLRAEGDFSQVVYDSIINYLIRRLINTAGYLQKKFDTDDSPEGTFLDELRSFLLNILNVPTDKVEKLLALLIACLEVKGKPLRNSRKENLRRKAKAENQTRCYICGCEVDFNGEDEYTAVEIEHMWPNSLGGPNKDFNLKISCRKCNKIKQNYIDASDFHYEEICLIHDKDDEKFSFDLRRDFKISLWAKNNYSCTHCGRSAQETGPLEFCRRNTNDSWHFLNIDTYCGEHAHE